MYKDSYVCEAISDDAKVWRYMSFAKYILFIDKKALYFQPLKKLENDPNEGNSTQRDLLEVQDTYESLESQGFGISAKEEIRKYNQKINRMKWLVRVNCWHINEIESKDMWNEFCSNGEGIAIQSTFKRLKESFSDNKGKIVHIGKVDYIDYNAAPYSPYESILANALQKEHSYQREKELRVLISKMPFNSPEFHGILFSRLSTGRNIRVNVENLVEKIVVLPYKNKLLFESVKSVTKKYLPLTERHKRVEKTSLPKEVFVVK